MYEIDIPRWWKYGRPADFWLRNLELVKSAIKEYGLQPVAQEYLMQGESFTQVPGGLKIPHFHLGRDLYLLDERQWNDFSTRVIQDFQAKLGRVNTVSFEQVMGLAEAMDGLV
jgi:hypothetical protein